MHRVCCDIDVQGSRQKDGVSTHNACTILLQCKAACHSIERHFSGRLLGMAVALLEGDDEH